MKNVEITWQEVLINKGFDPSTSHSLLGFISWNKKEEVSHLGKNMTKILSQAQGKVVVKDVASRKYNDEGLIFLSHDLSDEVANEIFDTIMDYEQKEVYGM